MKTILWKNCSYLEPIESLPELRQLLWIDLIIVVELQASIATIQLVHVAIYALFDLLKPRDLFLPAFQVASPRREFLSGHFFSGTNIVFLPVSLPQGYNAGKKIFVKRVMVLIISLAKYSAIDLRQLPLHGRANGLKIFHICFIVQLWSAWLFARNQSLSMLAAFVGFEFMNEVFDRP